MTQNHDICFSTHLYRTTPVIHSASSSISNIPEKPYVLYSGKCIPKHISMENHKDQARWRERDNICNHSKHFTRDVFVERRTTCPWTYVQPSNIYLQPIVRPHHGPTEIPRWDNQGNATRPLALAHMLRCYVNTYVICSHELVNQLETH